MKNQSSYLLIDVIALFLGIALTFAFAPYEIFPLAPLTLGGLLALWLKAHSPKQSFWIGFIFGVGLFGAGVYWVYISIHDIGEVPVYLSLLFTALLISFLALFPACVGYVLNRYFPPARNDSNWLYAFPAIWTLSEWVRSWLFSGFPWLLIGYSQTNSPLKGYAPIFSVYGVSLAIALTSALGLHSLLQFRQKNYKKGYISLFLLLSIWLFGALVSLIPWTHPQGKPVAVSLVQGNIPQTIKWSPEHLQLSFDRYANLTAPLFQPNRIIIWPEAALPISLSDAADFIEVMDQKALASNSHLILGIPIPATDGQNYFNGVITLGQQKMVYHKRRLVPFGEYTPFSTAFANLLGAMNIPMSNSISGQFNQPPLNVGGVKILPAICYEIAFADLMRTRDRTVNLLLTITNDAWFGKSNAEAQHLQMAAMRAIELGRPALFVSNDGITAIILPNGNIEAALPQYTTGVLNGTVQPTVGITPWMRNGMDPILFISICLLLRAILSNRKRQSITQQRELRS